MHHLSYEHFNNERDDELMLLCKKCHAEIHAKEKRKHFKNLDMFIKQLAYEDQKIAYSLLVERFGRNNA